MAQILGELVTHHSQRGEYKPGLRYAQHLLALEPWREETHRQVMRLLAASGAELPGNDPHVYLVLSGERQKAMNQLHKG